MLIKTEEYIKDGIEMVCEYYGPDENTVSGTIEYAKPVEGGEAPEEPEQEATQLDRIEAQTAYIAMMMDGGEV